MFLNKYIGISGSSVLFSILTNTINATIPIIKPAIIAGCVNPTEEPKLSASNMPQSAITSVIIPGTSSFTLSSFFWFGRFKPIRITPAIRGTAGIIIAA